MTLEQSRPSEWHTWPQEAQFEFDERVLIMSEGGLITPEMVEVATVQARRAQSLEICREMAREMEAKASQ